MVEVPYYRNDVLCHETQKSNTIKIYTYNFSSHLASDGLIVQIKQSKFRSPAGSAVQRSHLGKHQASGT